MDFNLIDLNWGCRGVGGIKKMTGVGGKIENRGLGERMVGNFRGVTDMGWGWIEGR